jgi:hypothetical protein
MKKLLVGIAVVLAAAATVQGATGVLRPLGTEGCAYFNATHVIEVRGDGLTCDTANTPTVFTNVVTAPCSVEFRGFLLDQQFDSVTVTNHMACIVRFGTTGATNKWISGVEVAADRTPTVTASFGTDYTGTSALTLPMLTFTNWSETTNVFAVVSNGTATVTLASPLLNEQSSDVSTVLTIGSPGASRKLSEFDTGRLRVFLRILQPGSGN